MARLLQPGPGEAIAWDGRWLSFRQPLRVLRADRVNQVRPLLAEVAQAGCWAVGYVRYEAAPAFDAALPGGHGTGPLAWFALYDEPSAAALPGAGVGLAPRPVWSLERYSEAFGAVRDALELGRVYQANLTFAVEGQGEPWPLWLNLVARQPSPYAAFVDAGDEQVLCASPELFFEFDAGRVTTRPMKGTRPRGPWQEPDLALADELRTSPKELAENLMIVDMLRNDLGRVAQLGSVRAGRLFEVERHPTVWQMTSTVEAETDLGWPEVFAALFPCASVTGAPKVAAMHLLHRLEPGARGVYCGAVGLVRPDGSCRFAVAIRTAVARGLHIWYGVGSGIVWDGKRDHEYAECVAKAEILRQAEPPFELLETVRWSTRGPTLWVRHVDRMKGAARYFGYADPGEALEQAASAVPPGVWKVRLLADREGQVRVERFALGATPAGPVRLGLACAPVDPSDPFLYHKTTRRGVYDRARADQPDADDVLLWNPDRELTETCWGNIIVRMDGRWVTPPVRCGLLDGTLRRELVERGALVERVVTLDELGAVSGYAVLNSVGGRRRAVLVR